METRRITKDEALKAVGEASFEIEGGRTILHCFLGSFGADWDIEGIEDLIFRADDIGWVKDLFGHDLAVLADGKVHRFDVKAPS